MTAPYTFTVPGRVVPYARTRPAKVGHYYNPKDYRNYRRAFALVAAAARPDKWAMGGRYRVSFEVRFRDRRTRDLDNVAKSIFDGMNKIAYVDDGQVDELQCRKVLTSPDPGVTVTVEQIE